MTYRVLLNGKETDMEYHFNVQFLNMMGKSVYSEIRIAQAELAKDLDCSVDSIKFVRSAPDYVADRFDPEDAILQRQELYYD